MLLNLASQTRRSRQVTECHHVGLAGFIAIVRGDRKHRKKASLKIFNQLLESVY